MMMEYKKTWHNESNPEVYHLAVVLSKQQPGFSVLSQPRFAVAGSWMAEALKTGSGHLSLITNWVRCVQGQCVKLLLKEESNILGNVFLFWDWDEKININLILALILAKILETGKSLFLLCPEFKNKTITSANCCFYISVYVGIKQTKYNVLISEL